MKRMQEIDGRKAMLAMLESGMRLPDYRYIMENLDKMDVSTNGEFQKRYNGFYKVRRSAAWREKYYICFEKFRMSRGEISFPAILKDIYEATNTVEASFASKMLATLKPEKPIIDSRVLHYLGLSLGGSTDKEKQDTAICIYQKIEDWYKEYITTPNAMENIAIFDKVLPDYRWLSSTKKIDYMLWGLG